MKHLFISLLSILCVSCSRVVSIVCSYLYLYPLTSWTPNFTIRRWPTALSNTHAAIWMMPRCFWSKMLTWIVLFPHSDLIKCGSSSLLSEFLPKSPMSPLQFYDMIDLNSESVTSFCFCLEAWRWLWAERASNRACTLYCLVCMPWPGLPVCPSLQSLCYSSVL